VCFSKSEHGGDLSSAAGRYRLVIVSGHAWFGDAALFGDETRVAEALRPVAVGTDQASPMLLAWSTDPSRPIIQVPMGLLVLCPHAASRFAEQLTPICIVVPVVPIRDLNARREHSPAPAECAQGQIRR